MHDCRTIKNRLVDLVFEELETDEKRRLLAAVETCAVCLGEYRDITDTLLVFDGAAEAAMPDENFWPEQRNRLRRRLAHATAPAISQLRRPDPLWKRIFTVRLPVPVPIAALILVALLVSSALAIRPSPRETFAEPQTVIVSTPAQPTVIEVPVFREKVLTRTVYVEKRRRERREDARPAPALEQDETTLTALHENESGEGGIFTRANLTGFQPPDELKIRIVKRSNLR